MTERGLKNINVFYSTFTNVFFNFFFWNIFYIYDLFWLLAISGGIHLCNDNGAVMQQYGVLCLWTHSGVVEQIQN